MTEPDLLTAAQTAVLLGCTQRTVARMVEADRITPAMKFPGETGAFLFGRAEVERVRKEIVDGLRAALQRVEPSTP